jgi:hypothetical protein
LNLASRSTSQGLQVSTQNTNSLVKDQVEYANNTDRQDKTCEVAVAAEQKQNSTPRMTRLRMIR